MSSQKLTSRTQKLRLTASKMLQKMKLSKSKDDTNLRELDAADIQVARFVTFVRPTEAPQIIDLKAMRQNIRPRLYTHHPSVPRSQAELKGPELRLQKSSESARLLDDVADEAGYEMLDDDEHDVDWSLLELSEKVYGRLANESHHSLI